MIKWLGKNVAKVARDLCCPKVDWVLKILWYRVRLVWLDIYGIWLQRKIFFGLSGVINIGQGTKTYGVGADLLKHPGCGTN